MEDKYRVISIDYLQTIIRGFAGNDSMTDACMEEIKTKSIPAQKLWDAAREDDGSDFDLSEMSGYHYKYENMNDFLTEQFDK